MTAKEFRERYGDNITELATDIAANITIRSYDEHGSHDTKRATTKPEHVIIWNIAYAALTSFQYRTDGTGSWDSILDMAEFTLMRFIPEANTYDTIYIPLRDVTETW